MLKLGRAKAFVDFLGPATGFQMQACVSFLGQRARTTWHPAGEEMHFDQGFALDLKGPGGVQETRVTSEQLLQLNQQIQLCLVTKREGRRKAYSVK